MAKNIERMLEKLRKTMKSSGYTEEDIESTIQYIDNLTCGDEKRKTHVEVMTKYYHNLGEVDGKTSF